MRYRGGPDPAGTGSLVAGAPPIYGSARIPLSAFLPPRENRARVDPERGMESLKSLYAMRQAIAARAPGVITRLLPEVEALERADPRNPAPPFERGRALRLLKRYGEAAEGVHGTSCSKTRTPSASLRAAPAMPPWCSRWVTGKFM